MKSSNHNFPFISGYWSGLGLLSSYKSKTLTALGFYFLQSYLCSSVLYLIFLLKKKASSISLFGQQISGFLMACVNPLISSKFYKLRCVIPGFPTNKWSYLKDLSSSDSTYYVSRAYKTLLFGSISISFLRLQWTRARAPELLDKWSN